MPSRPSPTSRAQAPPSDAVPDKDYKKLISFLRLASGFSLAVARCNFPALREEIIQRATKDAADMGLSLRVVDVSTNPSPDFVAMIRGGLDGAPVVGSPAIMVTGIGALIYQSASDENLRGEGRTPFTARLNFDRERIAHDLPYPLILWLESESLNVLLKQAPDLSQWISAHFDFGGGAVKDFAFERLFQSSEATWSQPKEQTHADLADFEGLLKELDETQGSDDVHSLRKRLAVLHALAVRYYGVGDDARAQTHLEQMLQLAIRLGDHRAEMIALGNLGLIYRATGHAERAIEYSEKALKIAREIGERRGEGAALGNLGITYAELGETQRAVELYKQALRIARETGDPAAEGETLGNLGVAYKSLGDLRRAVELYQQQLEIARKTGDRRREGAALGNLGIAYSLLGDVHRAIESHHQQLAITREVGDRRGEGNALGNLGVEYARLGQARLAGELFNQHLAIAREIGDRRGEASALWNMSLALHELGDRAQAMAGAEAALKALEQIEDPAAATVRSQVEEWRRAD